MPDDDDYDENKTGYFTGTMKDEVRFALRNNT